MKTEKKNSNWYINGYQAGHLALWISFALSRLFVASNTVKKMVDKSLVDIYKDLKFYLENRGSI